MADEGSDEIVFFFTDQYGYCGYEATRMEIAGNGLCAYDRTIKRVYMCDQDYAGAIGYVAVTATFQADERLTKATGTHAMLLDRHASKAAIARAMSRFCVRPWALMRQTVS